MKNPDPVEIFPVVDEDGNQVGEAPRSVCHDGKSMFLHPVVHLHVFNSKGELFLQKRSSTKDIQPGKWDTSVGGHVNPGEPVAEAIEREAEEELGLKGFKPEFLRRYVWKSARERELVYSYSTVTDQVPSINEEEIEEGRYWSHKEIRENFANALFTPNFEFEYKILFIV